MGEPPARGATPGGAEGTARRTVHVTGIVQGVGFRPTVHRMARVRGLTGTIANTSAGVDIEIQGARSAVDDFVERLPAEAPDLARILHLESAEIPCRDGEQGLRIVPSRDDAPRRALVLPDVALCADCERELFDPADRRHRYPFINCTNCGPRYTIVRDIPYDRPLTSMAGFPMCDACKVEYEDPDDRRFHAQATCCGDCGPQVRLVDREGAPVPTADPIVAAAARLADGEVLAIKGLGGFLLAADATNADAVARLRERKGRVGKPFAVMVPDVAAARRFGRLDGDALAALASPEAPILLVPKCEPFALCDGVAPGNADLGLFLPYTPLHRLLFDAGGFQALVMTSGNLSEEPIARDDDEALRRLPGLADAFLLHDRPILARCDDSVARVVGGAVRSVRSARGQVPVPLLLHEPGPSVLAVGGELKNSVCFTRGELAFLSQHVGDLDNFETRGFFEETVAHLGHLLGVEPVAIAHDLHPDYTATRWAQEQAQAQTGVELVGVQHHHAHVVSCMAEHRLTGRVLGIALDGTGFGTDGTIWGGELLLADEAEFERVGHLSTLPLPGASAAIREPWRVALAWLHGRWGEELFGLDLPFVHALDRGKAELIQRMITQDVRCPRTSSCGRLFDAVAALVGVRQVITYEAQAAIELEALAGGVEPGEGYPLELVDGVLDTASVLEALVEDLQRGESAAVVSARFHDGLVDGLARAAQTLAQQHGLDRVCLSGGTFLNRRLTEGLEARLRSAGLAVHAQAQVPTGDGGLALGQAVVARARLASSAG
jgi:hydrogenase maturation protein HypF